jgi:cation diffusion facilitator family transporter
MDGISAGMRLGLVGFVVDATLVLVKVIVAWFTGSRALMADSLYSMIDVLSACTVLGTFRLSRKGVDEEHPYGHGKIEFLAVAFVSMVIASFAVLLIYRVGHDLWTGVQHHPSAVVAWVAVLSLISCYLISRYAHSVGHWLNSPVILTNAEHHHADMLSSVAVLAAALLSWVGLGFIDPLIAALEVVHILHTSWRLWRGAMDGLLDAAVEGPQTGLISELAKGVAGVVAVDEVRLRSLGSSLWVELRLRVGPKRRMSDVGTIRELVRQEIVSKVANIGNVVIDVLPTVKSPAIATIEQCVP